MWSAWREAPAVVLYPPHLKKTFSIGLLIGTVLFCVNQLGVVVSGHATAIVWVRVAITYLVPFANSSAGVLIARRRLAEMVGTETASTTSLAPAVPGRAGSLEGA